MPADPAVLVAGRAWRGRRRVRFWWSAGMVLYSATILGVWPSIGESEAYADLAEDYPDALKAFFGGEAAFNTISTAPGFVSTYFFAFMLPLLLMALAAAGAAALLAGEDEDGQLQLVLSQPVSRHRVLAAKAAVIAAELVFVVALIVVVLLVGGPSVDLDIEGAGLIAASVGSVLFGLFHGALAFAVGAATGRRSNAMGVALAGGVAAYLLAAFAEIAGWLEPFRYLSAMYHARANDPLVNGVPVANYAVLIGATALALAAAMVLFQRHDLR